MSEDSKDQTAQQGGGTRSKILFGILAVGLVALAYDYAVARPAVNDAYDRIAEQSTKVNADSTKTFTNADVRALIGKEPSRSFDDANGDKVEVYSWRAGFPTKTHDLFAVYKTNNNQLLFHRHAKYQYESSGDVATVSQRGVIVGEEDDEAEQNLQAREAPYNGVDPADPSTFAGEDNGQGGNAGGRPRGGGFDPEAMFTENDADADGVLKDDEIPERMRERLADIDTDGDGGVSKEELMARIESMRGRRGGRDGEGGRRGRPESESEEEPAGKAEADPEESKPVEEGEEAIDPADIDPQEREGGEE